MTPPLRPLYQVAVDGLPMAHGPLDRLDPRHPQRMAATYQEINPDAVVTLAFRDPDGLWVATFDAAMKDA
jgi:hypothetical protein